MRFHWDDFLPEPAWLGLPGQLILAALVIWVAFRALKRQAIQSAVVCFGTAIIYVVCAQIIDKLMWRIDTPSDPIDDWRFNPDWRTLVLYAYIVSGITIVLAIAGMCVAYARVEDRSAQWVLGGYSGLQFVLGLWFLVQATSLDSLEVLHLPLMANVLYGLAFTRFVAGLLYDRLVWLYQAVSPKILAVVRSRRRRLASQ